MTTTNNVFDAALSDHWSVENINVDDGKWRRKQLLNPPASFKTGFCMDKCDGKKSEG